MSLLYACLNVRKFVDDLDLLTVQRFFEDNPKPNLVNALRLGALSQRSGGSVRDAS